MDENTAVQPADSVKNPVSLVECVQDCDGCVTGHIAVLKRGEVWGRVLCLCPRSPMPTEPYAHGALCPPEHLMLLRKAIILIIKGQTAVFMREAITTLATVFMAGLAGEEHKVSQF